MNNKLFSENLQKDIINALSIFHPELMTAKEYLSCFGDVNEYVMLANVEVLIQQGLIHHEAIRYSDGEPFLSLDCLKLQTKRYET